MKNRGHSPAKITRPVLSEVVPRKRLFRLMDEEGKKPLIWISGPAGTGKTSLVSSYLDARKLPCLWYRLDEGDNDIATFFYYMGLAAQKLGPKRKPLQLLTTEYLMGIPTFTKRFFENLCDRLNEPYAIVFDNYQDVPAASSFHEMIVHGLNAVPEGIMVFVIGRTEPPKQFARHRANNRMHCLGWEQIRLNLVEAQDIARKFSGGKRLPVEDLTEIYARTSGWVAGLLLVVRSLNGDSTDHRISANLARQEIFDYFASEIFDNLDTTLQQFLLRTALLPKVIASVAEQLTGSADADRILRKLSHGNYFTEQHLQTDPIYIYHPLFREFLLSRARRDMEPAEIRETQLTAARFLIAENQIEDAAGLFIEAGDEEGLVQLILTSAQGLSVQGRYRTLEGWIDKVPVEMHDAVPWLHFWKGVCLHAVDLAASRAHLERAFNLFVAQDDHNGMLLSWSNIVDSLILERNNYTLLDDWIDWMEAHIGNNDPSPPPEIEAQVAAAMAGAYTWRRPGDPECKKWVERALRLARGLTNVTIQLKSFSHATVYYGWTGNFVRCIEVINEAAKFTRSRGVPSMLMTVTKCHEAVSYIFSVEHYEKAFKSFIEASDIVEKTGVHVLDHFLYSSGFYISLCIDNMEMAGECLEKMRTTVTNDQLTNEAQYHSLAAWLYLLAGNVSVAWDHAEKSVSLGAASGAIFPEMFSRHVAALTLHKMGEFEAADDMLARAIEIVQRANSTFYMYLCLLAEAEFSFYKGDEPGGREALRKALAIGRKNDYATTACLWRTSVLSRLCAKALAAGIETEYVKSFIKKCKLLPDSLLDSEHWPRPIKVYTLGRFSILRDGEPIKFSGKVQQKPLSMLKAVIALGGRDVHEDQLIDALWPEADGDVAHSSLRTTVHRLRQLLGNNDSLQFSESRISLDWRYCWVDAWGFQRIASEAENMWKRGPCGNFPDADNDHKENVIAASERAVNLYKGDFLSGDLKYPWAFSMRERLKSKFVRLINHLGSCHEHSEQWEKAIEYYRRALETDSLQEEFYRKLMICYQKCGERAEALAAYKRCRDELSSALAIEPSRETIRIYEALRNVKPQ